MEQECAVAIEPAVVFEPAVAAVEMQAIFRRAAKRLRKDRHLREDLVQEMSLAVLRCRRSHSLAYFLKRGIWKAIKFLKRWERGKKLNEPVDYEDERITYDPVVLAARRQAAIEELKRRGAGFLLEELSNLKAVTAVAARMAA
jgi:hypothetical protein